MKRYYRLAGLLLCILLLLGTAFLKTDTIPTLAVAPSTTATTTGTTTAVSDSTTIAGNASPAPTKPVALDATYERLVLVNAKNPLTKDYDNQVKLTDIPKKYLNGSLRQIDQGIYPYLEAMIEAAKADGIALYVRSPFRSYNTQAMLFKNKVNNVIKSGTPKEEAEAAAARAVAREGTSEHQTGLAVDINTASSKFENTPAHKWMVKNAENYGFILRYPEGKTEITGIMYEPWHWRFVGINTAKEINRLGITLEEYLEQKAKG